MADTLDLASSNDEYDTDYYDVGEDGDPNQQIEMAEDGSLIVTLGDEAEQPKEDGGFYDNLADGLIPEMILDRIATDLLRKIEEDKESRKKRDEQYEDGLRRTGMGKDAPGGAEFEGASKVVHPMLTEACIDYESRIIKEVWPVGGPVKKKIIGEVTAAKEDRATRKVDYMNYQLTTVMEEARDVLEQTLTQVPLGGAQYIKQYWDERLSRPTWEFVPIDKVLIPGGAKSFYTADRRTVMDTISAVELKRRVDQGMYRDLKLPPASATPAQTKAEKANDKITGRDADTGQNIDGDREIFEVMVLLEVSEEMADALGHEEAGDLCPYLLTIDEQSKKVLSFYRDWEETDEARQPIDHLYEIPFIYWRGPTPIGLPQIFAGLPGAATGALRALLDSAHIANVPTGYILKGSGASGQTKRPNPGELVEIDGGVEASDIRQKVMFQTFAGPNPVLFQLLGFLVEASKNTVRTTMDDLPQGMNPANMPVGTQFSRVEEGLVVFSGVHGRVHKALNRIFMGLHRLNRMYLPDVIKVDAAGKEILIRRRDFMGPPDVQPVSDPEVYSDMQRWAQLGEMERSATMFPQLFDMREIQKRKLKLLKIADPDALLTPIPKPEELNAVNENLAMALGKPAAAFPDQDHLAHLQAHLDFMQSPVFGFNPMIAPVYLPIAIRHCMEHMLLQYISMTDNLVTEASGRKASELMGKDPDVKRAFDRLLALASQHIVPEVAQTFAKALPVLQKAQQMLSQIAQSQQPPDAAMAATHVAAAEVQRKGAADQLKAQTDQAKLAIAAHGQNQKDQSEAQKNALDAERINVMRDNAALAAQTKLEETAMDNASAQQISEMRVESGESPRFSTGSSMGG